MFIIEQEFDCLASILSKHISGLAEKMLLISAVKETNIELTKKLLFNQMEEFAKAYYIHKSIRDKCERYRKFELKEKGENDETENK
jgi:hypothetical protein